HLSDSARTARSPPPGLIEQLARDRVPSFASVLSWQATAEVTALCQLVYDGFRKSLLPIPLFGKRFNIEPHEGLEFFVPALLRPSQQLLSPALIHSGARSFAGQKPSSRSAT